MEFKILTNNIWVDQDGIDQGLLHIEISTETEVWTKAERIPSADAILIKNDPTAVNILAQAMANKAVIQRPAEKIQEEHMRSLESDRLKLETIKAEIELMKMKQGLL
jgi:hypothetical protein